MDKFTAKETIAELEKKCRSLDRQNQLLIEHIKRSDSLIQNQEMRICKLEKLTSFDKRIGIV